MRNNDAIIIESTQPPLASIIWLHGLGADGHDFATIVPDLKLKYATQIRFIFPHAPKRPVTINGGLSMRAWYDVKDPDLSAQQDRAGILDSVTMLTAYIDTEIASGVHPEQIIIAGFSQGGAIALFAGLHYPATLGGILALSTYLPLADELPTTVSNTPIMMMHGQQDPIIPIQQAQSDYKRLAAAGYQIIWQDYPMPHSVSIEEINDISAWLQKICQAGMKN